MADTFGYSQLKSDKPELWLCYGSLVITDGYGSISFQHNICTSAGVLATVDYASPSSVFASVAETTAPPTPGSGVYNLYLTQTWAELLYADFKVMSSNIYTTQLVATTVANSSYGPGQAALQGIEFKTLSSGSAAALPQGTVIYFEIVLKNSLA